MGLSTELIQAGISVTPSNNFQLDATAADGSFTFKRADGSTIFTVDATGLMDIGGAGAVYGKDNILGTVSQVGGIPTGALMEHDSSVNGEYWKYANGQQITYFRNTGVSIPVNSPFGSMFYSANYALDFPAEFVAPPFATTKSHGTGIHDASNLMSPTGLNIQFASPVNTTVVTDYTLIAIGRWY